MQRCLQCRGGEPQATPRREDQADVIVTRQSARGRNAQILLELLEQLERAVDVSGRRVGKLTRHGIPNIGQIALVGKTPSRG